METSMFVFAIMSLVSLLVFLVSANLDEEDITMMSVVVAIISVVVLSILAIVNFGIS